MSYGDVPDIEFITKVLGIYLCYIDKYYKPSISKTLKYTCKTEG